MGQHTAPKHNTTNSFGCNSGTIFQKNKNVETIKITSEVIEKRADPILIFKKEVDGLPQKQISR